MIKLAEIFKIKYGFNSFASAQDEKDVAQIIKKLKKEIDDAHKNWILNTAVSPLQQLGQNGETFSRRIVNNFDKLVANLDNLDIDQIFNAINGMQTSINSVMSDEKRIVFNAVWDSYPSSNARQKADREQGRSRFEKTLARLSSIFNKMLIVLKKVGIIVTEIAPANIDGGKRMALSDKYFYDWSFTDPARELGLDDVKIMSKIIQDLELREQLTTIVNALSRGHNPRDWKEFKSEVAKIIKRSEELAAIRDNSRLFEDKE